MENKYYVPKVDEFHVGFEFEEGDYVDQPNEFWTKQICGKDDTGDLQFYDDVIREGAIRVKYLDKEDIESLRFEQIDDLPEPFTFRIKYKHYFAYLHFYRIENEIPKIVIDSGEGVFSLNIKNKSELKRLLVQLEIIDNS